MSYNYGQYGDSGTNTNDSGIPRPKRQSDTKLKLAPSTIIEGDLSMVFGNEYNGEQSLAIKLENTALIHGVLYQSGNANNPKLRTFNWAEIAGKAASPDFQVTADMAKQFHTKTWFGKNYEFELVGARVQAVETQPEFPENPTQEQIEEVLESFEPEEIYPADPAEPVSIAEGNVIMWYSGSEQYGPKSASKTLARVLCGDDVVVLDHEGNVSKDLTNWLTDVSGDNLLRPELEGRRVAIVEKPSEAIDPKTGEPNGRTYNHALVFDAKLGERLYPPQADENDAGGAEGSPSTNGQGQSRASMSDLPSKASNQSDDEMPAEFSDFVAGCRDLDYQAGQDEARAAALLVDLARDPSSPITQELVEDLGGVDAVVAQALQ